MRFISRDKTSALSTLRQKGCALTIGNFDGVHIGHQAMLVKLKEAALTRNILPLVVIFEPQPLEFFRAEQAPPRIMRLRDKIQRLFSIGIDNIVCLSFNQQLANLSPEIFVTQLLIEQLNVKYILTGEDFHFGNRRAGNISTLQALGDKLSFEVVISETICDQNSKIGSTEVRQALNQSDFFKAQKLLGERFYMSGRVIHGNKLGRTINVPTANIGLKHQPLIINGIFAVKVSVTGSQDWHEAVANIGYRPTIADNLSALLEVHIFNFDKNLYGKRLKVIFLKKIRDEKKFDSFELMTKSIKEDITNTKMFFKENAQEKVSS